MAVTSKLSSDAKAVIWHLWRDGQPMMLIARRVNRVPSSIFSYLRYHGGIHSAVQYRRSNALTFEERQEIRRRQPNRDGDAGRAIYPLNRAG